MKCPSCNSTNCAKLYEIQKQGTTYTASQSAHVGVSNVGVGASKGASVGMSMTEEAKAAAFVQKQGDGSVWAALMAIIAGALTYGVYYLAQLIGWSLGWWYVLIFFVIMAATQLTPLGAVYERQEERHKKEQEDYEKTWKCRDCGHQWVNS